MDSPTRMPPVSCNHRGELMQKSRHVERKMVMQKQIYPTDKNVSSLKFLAHRVRTSCPKFTRKKINTLYHIVSIMFTFLEFLESLKNLDWNFSHP